MTNVVLAGAGAFGIKHLDGIEKIDGVQVTGLVGLYCDNPFETCHTDPPFDPTEPDEDFLVQRVGNMVFIRLPSDLPVDWFQMPSTEGVHTAQADNRTW